VPTLPVVAIQNFLNCDTISKELHWATKFNFFFGTRGKISVPNRTFNAEFKYVSSFSP
jgi:hypothetical protein